MREWRALFAVSRKRGHFYFATRGHFYFAATSADISLDSSLGGRVYLLKIRIGREADRWSCLMSFRQVVVCFCHSRRAVRSSPYGRVSGRIVDSAGAVVPGAKVR